MPLGADHAGQIAVQDGMDTRGVKGRPRAVDEGCDPVFLGLGRMVGKAIKLLGQERMLMRPVEVEEAGVEDRTRIHMGAVGFD